MGSLMSVFKSLEGGTDFDLNQKLPFCIDAAAGMKYLHSLEPPLIHRDLKPQNLLVTSNWRVKIADFGTAKLLGTTTTTTKNTRTTPATHESVLTERFLFFIVLISTMKLVCNDIFALVTSGVRIHSRKHKKIRVWWVLCHIWHQS